MDNLYKFDINDELKNIKAVLDDIINYSYDGIYITNGKGVFLEVNGGLERITGIKREDLIGTNAIHLVAAGIIDHSVTAQVLETKQRVTRLQKVKGKTIKEVMITSTPILNEEGDIKYIVANLRDMTELNYLKHQCEKAQQLYNQYYTELQKEKYLKEKIIAESEEMRRVLELANKVAQVDSTVLLEGDSGVGKEVIARFIHEVSPRRKKSFISINCAAIPENLLEAELFGYEEGAFTGAKREGKIGMIELADQGTLFLDEIESLPINLQGKILRAIETLEINPVGSTACRQVDTRFIAATNISLEDMVERGLFRKDLFFRLNVVPIQIPPLHRRKKDIIPLITYFMQLFNERYKRKKEITCEALDILEHYCWPGNVRELKNIIERVVVMSSNTTIHTSDLPLEVLNSKNINQKYEINIHEVVPLKEFMENAEKQLVKKALSEYKTTRSVARALGISQASVVRLLKK